MNEYYGSNLASSDFFAHYGVKGMKWGVRKALKKTGEARTKALTRQYNKATKKYNKLLNKADLTQAANNAYAHRAIMRGTAGFGAVQGGLGTAMLLQEGKKALPMAGFLTAPTLAVGGVAGINYLRNKKRMTSKGHAKAVEKVKNWEKEYKKAFKDTKIANSLTDRKYDDTYEIYEGNDDGYKEKTIAKIRGSHLTSDYKGKDKQRFLKTAGKSTGGIKGKKNSSNTVLSDPLITVNRDYITSTKNDDPMSFNYNYHSLTRKRKEKKLPFYMSSKEAYRSYSPKSSRR